VRVLEFAYFHRPFPLHIFNVDDPAFRRLCVSGSLQKNSAGTRGMFLINVLVTVQSKVFASNLTGSPEGMQNAHFIFSVNQVRAVVSGSSIGDHFIVRSLFMLRAETNSVTGPCDLMPDRCMFDLPDQLNLSGVLVLTNDVLGKVPAEAAFSIIKSALRGHHVQPP